MTIKKIALPLLVTSTLWLSTFPMKTTNTIAPISLDNSAIIPGATFFKIHTKDECTVHINIGSYYANEEEFSSSQIPSNTTFISFHNGKGDIVLLERGTSITETVIADYADKRLDKTARHEIVEAVICKKSISFYNQSKDIVAIYDICEDSDDVTIKDIQNMFKDADDLDLSNLSKIGYFLKISSVIKQACNDFCIFQ